MSFKITDKTGTVQIFIEDPMTKVFRITGMSLPAETSGTIANIDMKDVNRKTADIMLPSIAPPIETGKMQIAILKGEAVYWPGKENVIKISNSTTEDSGELSIRLVFPADI